MRSLISQTAPQAKSAFTFLNGKKTRKNTELHPYLLLCVWVCVCVCVCVFVRVRALPPLVPGGQVVTLLHQDVEGAGLVAVADVEQDLAAHPGVAIVTRLAVHAHHAVYAALLANDRR